MPDPTLPNDLDQIVAATPVWPRGLPELRAMLDALPPMSPSFLPGTNPAQLPIDSTTTADASGGSTLTGPSAGSLVGEAPGTVSGVSVAPGSVTASSFSPSVSPIITVATKPDLGTAPNYNPAYPLGTLIWDESTLTVYKNVAWVWERFDGVAGPPGVVASYPGEPTLPDADWPIDTLYFDTNVDMLKKNVNDVWVPIVNAADLAGQITSGQIGTDQVLANHILSGEIKTRHLATDFLLASLIRTAATGYKRLELDQFGLRVYGDGDVILVNLPTDGSAMKFNGTVEALTLTSWATQLLGNTSFTGSAVATLANGVTDPASAPTLASILDYRALPVTPTGHGINYAASGGFGGVASYWIGGDPSVPDAPIAYEIKSADGTLLRVLYPSNTSDVTTETVGSTSHISDSAQAKTGSINDQIATPITIPTRSGTIEVIAVAAWFAGYGGSCVARTMLWNSSGTRLGYSSAFTAASRSFANGNSILYNKNLTAAVAVSSGQVVHAGFCHTDGTEGFQWDRDDGSGHTQYHGDGGSGNMTGGDATLTTTKPNVYLTIRVTQTVTVEGPMGKVVGLTRASTGGVEYLWVLDSNGKLFQYKQSDLTYMGQYDLSASIPGVKASAGLFFDGTYLCVTTTAAASGSAFVTIKKFDPATPGTLNSTRSTNLAVDAGAATVRGGRDDGTYLWLPIVDAGHTGVYCFENSTGNLVANRDFGQANEFESGVTHDGTVFQGFKTNAAKIVHFTAWDWSVATTPVWVAYTWYDGTYETGISPIASLTVGRRRRLNITNPSLPTSQVRIYAVQQSGSPTTTQLKREVTDANLARYIEGLSGSVSAPSSNNFPSGTAAQLKSQATGFTLKGDGTINRVGTSFPTAPATNDHFWRSDLGLEFYYDGTRWLSTNLYKHTWDVEGQAATFNHKTSFPGNPHAAGIWAESLTVVFFVSGGTALSASHKWVGVLTALKADNTPGATTYATVNVNSGASSTWRVDKQTIGQSIAYDTTNVPALRTTWTKTGTPGDIYAYETLAYRLVAT